MPAGCHYWHPSIKWSKFNVRASIFYRWSQCLTYCINHIIDADRKTDHDAESMLQPGTLQHLLDNVAAKSPVALNVLELPLGRSAVSIPPMFTDIATDAYSIPYVKHLVRIMDLRDVLSWGTAGTANALSWAHIDAAGFATAVSVQTGAKLWVMADSIRKDPLSDDMGHTGAFNGWGVRNVDPQLWKLEAILLRPNSVL